MMHEGDYDDADQRLVRFAGKLCPVCHALNLPHTPLRWDGRRLVCDNSHSYSNPCAAEEEVTDDAP